MHSPRACGDHVTFQIVCYDWIKYYFCKQRQENWDWILWERTTTTENGETLLMEAIPQRLQVMKCSYNEEKDFGERYQYLHGVN